jgi:hypothetical protein
VSTGLKQLDEILGGGITLGSVLYLEEDQYSSHAETLMAYSIAESISSNCQTIIITSTMQDAERILSSIPFNLTLRHQAKDSDSDSSIRSVNEDNNNNNNNNSSSTSNDSSNDIDSQVNSLKIAWQYGKYLAGNLSLLLN